MKHRKSVVGRLRSTFVGLLCAAALLTAAAYLYAPAAAQTVAFVELASFTATGIGSGNGPSTNARSSDDGRLVVFESAASDLVSNDTNGTVKDVFVRDMDGGPPTLVSVNAAGTGSGDGESRAPSITPNGRYVLFVSSAKNLVSATVTGFTHLYLRDLVAQTTTYVSVDSTGAVASTASTFSGSITPDGRYAAYNRGNSIHWRDLQTNTVKRLDSGTCDASGSCFSASESITPDGRYVSFASNLTLVANDTNGTTDVYRYDTQTDTIVLVSVNKDGIAPMTGTRSSFSPSMSDDGQIIAFESTSTDIVPSADPVADFTSPSIYARNLTSNTTTLVSENRFSQSIPPAAQPRISADGRYVFYLRREVGVGGLSFAGNRDRIFRRDFQNNSLVELPFVATGICEQGFNCRSIVEGYITSRDGRYVAYHQRERPASNFAPFSTAIIVRDMVGGGAEIVVGMPGVPFNFTNENQQILTPGSVVTGGKLAFSSGVSHASLDTNGLEDAYLFAPPAQNRLAFSRAAYTASESGASAVPPNVIEVRRAGYLIDSTVTVKLATSDGTAVAGSDYSARSETLTFNPGETVKTLTIQLANDEVVEPDETLTLTLSEPTGNATLGSPSSATLTVNDDEPHQIQFVSSGSTSASETSGSFVVSVIVSGSPTAPLSVAYTTSDGTASERSDYITAAGRLTFAPGERTKSIRVFIVDDGLTEPDETLTLTLSNPQGTNAVLGPNTTNQLIILSNDSPPPSGNPIDGSEFFVRQHYLDFLNREPDQSGFLFWTNEIESCGADAQCREVKRINVSAAFFLSIEFQTTGLLAYLTNKAAFDTRPTFAQFQRDVQALQRGFVFGQPGAPARLEANKRAYFDEFVTRPEFVTKFGGMSNFQYARTLLTENNLSTSAPVIFVSRLEGQTPSQLPSTPPGVVIVRRDPDPPNPTVRLALRLNNLSGAPTAVHIHGPAAAGETAPILHTLPAEEFADLRLTLTNEQINFLNTGRLYVDVHTQNNAVPELRAQLGPSRFHEDVLSGALDNQTLTRAQVLRIVAESEELRRAEFNAAFVLMEYFGYLRRDPDEEGYSFWLDKLNDFNGDFIRAEMVKAFISSTEYRGRFGQP